MQYTTVFDVARDGFAAWGFPAGGLILVATGVALVVYHRRRANTSSRRSARVFRVLFLGFAVCWTLVAFAATFTDYVGLRRALLAGEYSVVEGEVTNFKPAPAEGHANEEFDVGGRHYSFSDYVVIAGYHRSRSHGGVLREGLRVRIADVRGQIARLEVAADSAP